MSSTCSICNYIGDIDCNDMFTDDVCLGLEYCSEILGKPYTAPASAAASPPPVKGTIGAIGNPAGLRPLNAGERIPSKPQTPRAAAERSTALGVSGTDPNLHSRFPVRLVCFG